MTRGVGVFWEWLMFRFCKKTQLNIIKAQNLPSGELGGWKD